MKLKKITPVIVVDAIEPCLEFWVDRLGFTKTVEVPHEGALGFVILNHSPTEIMLQSRASVEADVPGTLANGAAKDGVGLFIEVEGPLDPWVAKLRGMAIAVERRTTFYGADEIGVHAPDGPLVMFASFAGANPAE